MTIYVHSEHQGYPSQEFWGTDPGHAYITPEKSNGANRQSLTFGFCLKEKTWVIPTKNAVASGIDEEYGNSQRRSDIRYSITVSPAQFEAAIAAAAKGNGTKPYDLNY